MVQSNGKKALVTAASSGIGLATARVLAENGYSVIMSTSNEQKISGAAAQLKTSGLDVHHTVFDMTTGDTGHIVEHVKKQFGNIDALVVNFGDPKLAPFLELERSDWDKNDNMFIKSTIGLVRGLVPLMGQGGRIVFITSLTTREAYKGFAISGALRAAVVNLGKTLSIELGPKGITVNSISQGYFMTPRMDHVLETNAARNGTTIEQEKEAIIKAIPLGRVGDPREIGHLVTFLCSGEASYITGANIPIDGGFTRYPY